MVLRESDLTELEPGDEAPPFELVGVDDETYALDDFADDEALLVVFTCNHCPYAKAKFGLLNDVAASYDAVSVVGINPNDPTEYPEDRFEKMKEYVDAGRVKYDAYLFDESQDVARSYGATCTPDPYLFDNDDGAFRLVYRGRLDDALSPEDTASEFYIREAIDAVLADDPVDLDWLPSQGCSIKWRS